MFSHTQFGLSFIMLTFDDDTTDMQARQQTLERLAPPICPRAFSRNWQPLSTAIGEIYRYVLKGDGYTTRDLRTLEDWVVERNLRAVPGVADVVTFGGLVKTYEVNPHLARMRYYGISLQQLYTALGRGNANVGGSKVTQGSQQYLIRGVGMLRSADEIKSIVITAHNGTPILVKDIADVTLGNLPVEGIMGQDDDGRRCFRHRAHAQRREPFRVLTALKARIELLNSSILPKGVKVVPYYDRTWLIDTTLHTVFKNLAEGAMLVTFVLLLFLGNFRAAAIVAFIIPLSLLATFIGLTWRGIPANLLSLGAMDFGIIVDGAVIVVENVFRRLGELKDTGSDKKARLARDRTRHRRGRAADLLLDAHHHRRAHPHLHAATPRRPHLRADGLDGHQRADRLAAPFAHARAAALPVPAAQEHPPRGERPRALHQTALPGLAALGAGSSEDGHRRWRWPASAPAWRWRPGSARSSCPSSTKARSGSTPTCPPGISVEQARAYCRKMRDILRRTPEVGTVVSKSGRPEDGTDPKPINMAEIFVDLKPPGEWKRGLTKATAHRRDGPQPERAARHRDQLLDQPIRDNVLESISQIDGQVVIKVFGDDSAALRKKAQEMLPGHRRRARRGHGGAWTARAKCRRRSSKLTATAPPATASTSATSRTSSKSAWPARRPRNCGRAKSISASSCACPKRERSLRQPEEGAGGHAGRPAHPAGTSRHVQGNRRQHEHQPREQHPPFGHQRLHQRPRHGQRRGRHAGAHRARFPLPHGWFVTWSGEFENQQRAMKRLAIIVPISIFLIFVLLFDAFKSVKSALLILVNVPLGLIGGIFALAAHRHSA